MSRARGHIWPSTASRASATSWTLDLVWKPFLVGGVFNKVNPSVYQRRENPIPPKDAYYRKDMDDWARYEGIVIGKPSVFPVNSVKAMRGCFHAIDEGRVSAFARGCFEAYWRDDRDIGQEDVLAEVVESAGLDKQRFFAAIADPGDQAEAVRHDGRADRAGRLRLADLLPRRRRHVFRQ